MIQADKWQHALRSLHFALTRAHNIAAESRNTELALLLDNLEILPKYIAEVEDRTNDFRDVLVSIDGENKKLAGIISIFDAPDAGNW